MSKRNRIAVWLFNARFLATACGALIVSIIPAHAETMLPMNGNCTYFSEVFRQHQRKGHIAPRPTPEGFRAFIANDANLTVTDVTARLGRKLHEQRAMRFRPISYAEIVDYYRLQLTLWQRVFRELSIRGDIAKVLGKFSGQTTLSMSETFRIPFAPISADIDEPFETNFYKLEGRYQDQPFLGMRTKITLLRAPRELCPQTLYLSYMPDINARMLGFSHAQLIPELSLNVMPAFAFEYNGLHHWEKHSTLKEHDQLRRPIPLTNFAHLGRTYVVSGHPDFSLMLEDYEAPKAILTFFLWRAERKITAPNADLMAPPDFVYQIEIGYRDARPAR